eukprot:2511668-Pyramimonas_sp.AAC.1
MHPSRRNGYAARVQRRGRSSSGARGGGGNGVARRKGDANRGPALRPEDIESDSQGRGALRSE